MRLITRCDFDGLVCAALLSEVGVIDEFRFVHPKDVQDGKIEVTENDVLTNIPFSPGCGLWFDHHVSEIERANIAENFKYKGQSSLAPSCARVIYDYYGGAEVFSKFDETGLMEAVDKSDSGQLTIDDILRPKGWMLLSFIMDSRTGFGRCQDFRISNFELMSDIIKYCGSMTAEEILEIPDVKERIIKYHEQERDYEDMIRENSIVDKNVLVIDLHEVDHILPGNRFKEYVLFPEQNISVRIIWGYRKKNMVLTCGHSIINRTSNTHVAKLMMKYGGGGHRAVGTCQVDALDWESVRDEIVERMKADG